MCRRDIFLFASLRLSVVLTRQSCSWGCYGLGPHRPHILQQLRDILPVVDIAVKVCDSGTGKESIDSTVLDVCRWVSLFRGTIVLERCCRLLLPSTSPESSVLCVPHLADSLMCSSPGHYGSCSVPCSIHLRLCFYPQHWRYSFFPLS